MGTDDRIAARLRDEHWNIFYVAAYMNRLREAAPPGSSWPTVYGVIFDPAVRSYNSNPEFIQSFAVSQAYYSYLDQP